MADLCPHNAKLRKEGVCEKCTKEYKPSFAFQMCKKKCLNCKECGWFKAEDSSGHLEWHPHQFGVKVMPPFTAESVKTALIQKWDAYYTKLSTGQSPTWKCDHRTVELWCLSQYLNEKLMMLSATDEDRRAQLLYWNQKSRAENDLYALAALTLNNFCENKINRFVGKYHDSR